MRYSITSLILGLFFLTSPDATAQGRHLALVSNHDSSSLGVIDLDLLVEIADIPLGFEVPRKITVTPDGRRAFVLCRELPAQIVVVDLEALAVESALEFPGNLRDIEVSPDGRWLVGAARSPVRIVRYDLEDPAAPASIMQLAPGSAAVEFDLSRDGRTAFLTMRPFPSDPRIFEVDVESMTVVRELGLPRDPRQILAIDDPANAGRDLVLVTTSAPDFLVYSTETGHVSTFPTPTPGFQSGSVEYDADRQRVVLTDDTDLGAGIPFEPEVFITNLNASVGTLLSTDEYGGAGIRVSRGKYFGAVLGGGVAILDPDEPGPATSLSTPPIQVALQFRTAATDRTYLYASHLAGGAGLTVVDTATDQLLADVPLAGVGPVFIATVECRSDSGIDRCLGSGAGDTGCAACPCDNDASADAGSGCVNSSGVGARLTSSGSPSLSVPSGSDLDLRFALEGAPPFVTSILISGDALAPAAPGNPCFGLGTGVTSAALDGLRCAVGSVQRHGVRSVSVEGTVGAPDSPWGGEGAPDAGLLAIVAGNVLAGETRYFQVVLRENPSAGCGTGLATSQAVEITLCP